MGLLGYTYLIFPFSFTDLCSFISVFMTLAFIDSYRVSVMILSLSSQSNQIYFGMLLKELGLLKVVAI